MNDFQIPDHLLLVLQQVKENYQQPKQKRKRGKPPTYSDLSFLLLCVAAVILRTFDDIELHGLLIDDEIFRQSCAFEQVPHRKTIGRRLTNLIARAEEQIRLCGQQIVETIASASAPLVSAIDGRMYEASGAKWHAKDRAQGIIPANLRAVDTESYWSKSNYRGWIQGYRLIVQTLVLPVPVPLSAHWTGNMRGRINNFQANVGA